MIGLANYLAHGIGAVEGWLSPTTAAMIARILTLQIEAGIAGDVCEIGVHHGRLFLILANALASGETAVAVDVFGDQEKNVDQSGRGERAVFERNVARYAAGARVTILQDSSLDLPGTAFAAQRFRFLSIDGGHTAEITANDLRLAEATLTEAGVVALDDILSAHWTGVITGLVRYLQEGGTLVPFALVPNKLFLARPAQAGLWEARLREAFPMALAKTGLEFLGFLVSSFNEHPYYDLEAHGGLRRERDAMAAERAALLAERDHLAAMQAGLRQQLDQMRVDCEKAETMHRAMLNSTSWKITGPLRRLAGG